MVAGATVCQVCGHPVPSAEMSTQRKQAGLPAGRYVPSVYGPPVRPDVVPRASEMEAEAPPRRTFGYRPVDLPPPPPERGGSLRRRLVRLLLVALVLGVAVTAVAFAKGALPPHAAPAPSGKAPVVGVRATATTDTGQVCSAAAQVDASAAQALAQAQLTSGLRNAGAHDYRPVNAVSSFHVGQTGYVTFQVATTEAGTASVLFCMPAEQVSGSLSVPAGSSGRYGEFSAQFGARDVGKGHALLTWNGAVAADVPFTVSR